MLRESRLPALSRYAWVEVDVDILRSNAETLVEYARPASLAPVVKADGYGHGLEMAARCAVAAGVEWLCVANSHEAVRLRTDGYRGRVFVLYPVPDETVAQMASLRVDLSAGCHEDIDRLTTELRGSALACRVHLEVDTGMTRGGCAPETAPDLALKIDGTPELALVGMWSHLAAPEDQDATNDQVASFEETISAVRSAGVDPGLTHFSASGGMLAADNTEMSLIRPGLAFYGLHPDAGAPLPQQVEPALAVRCHPVRVTRVGPGTKVGYGGTWQAERQSTIATLPMGYADGWARNSSPGTSALVNGQRAPLVGRVSSDAITVDVTDVGPVDLGTEFTLLGSDGDAVITAEEIAEVRGTISWEVLQQLGARLARVYVSDDTVVASRPESDPDLAHASSASAYRYQD